MSQDGYFDHNATTPLDPRVREEMLPWMGEQWGNPSSVHRFGRAAREAVEQGRDRVAGLIGGDPLEIVFTASGTEASNAVVASCCDRDTSHLVLSSFEHPAIQQAAARVESRGGRATRVDPNAAGAVSAGAFTAALEADTHLACLMLANNELGTVQPVAAVATECRARGIPLYCDAVQAAGKIPVRVDLLDVDYLVIGGHKFHGPLGAAALWIKSGVQLVPLLVGGGQERQRRSGTPDVPAIVGLGMACELARRDLEERAAMLGTLRDRFEAGLASIGEARVHCRDSERLPNTSHVGFPGIDANALVIRLDLHGYAVSTGSACSSGAVEISPTLAAIGLDAGEASGSLRVSFGLTNTTEEVDGLLAALVDEVGALRRDVAPQDLSEARSG